MEKLMKNKLVVIGGGAAGILASIMAARLGWQVLLLEKNEKLGKKLFITGKGRCNITNACDMEEFFSHVITGRKFMYSSFYDFHNYDMMDFLKELGLHLKIERGGRVFPESDKSSDVIKVLEKELKRLHVQILLHTKVLEIKTEDLEHDETIEGKKKLGMVRGVLAKVNKKTAYFLADAVIVATGGLSYPSTGSTGDGYRFAKETGHEIIEPIPSLVPFETKEAKIWGKDLMGVSLKNISITIYDKTKKLYHDFGEMLFTHFGVSGPLILSASSIVAKHLLTKPLTLSLDLKPALSKEQLDARLLRDFTECQNKQLKHAFDKLLPKALIAPIIEKTKLLPEKKINQITKEERAVIIDVLKDFQMTITGVRGFSEAIITKGGIALNNINPSTMESKKIKGLYFIGEVLDIDALTGGFNLQIAWSTAAAAARGLSKKN